MSMEKAEFDHILATYCGGDWKRISFICTTATRPMYLRDFMVPGRGVKFVDDGILYGFIFYDYIPQSAQQSTRLMEDGKPVKMQETYFAVDLLDHVGWYPLDEPDYVTPEPPKEP